MRIFILDDENDIQKRFLKLKLVYNGAIVSDILSGQIDYILEDKYNGELMQTIKKYKSENRNCKIVNQAYFSDILDRKNYFNN